MRSFLVAFFVLLAGTAAAAPALAAAEVQAAAAATASAQLPVLLPAPYQMTSAPCRVPVSLDRPLRFPAHVDAGGFELLSARWKALGIVAPVLQPPDASDVHILHTITMTTYAPGKRPRIRFEESNYELLIGDGVTIHDGSFSGTPSPTAQNEGEFDALMTLAQLPQRNAGRWVLPCVSILDGSRLRWRIVSDDVSRGPFPTMTYAKERIRTLASLKMNGWSPYMEQVVADPRYPYVATPNGWTTAQLHELTIYARRFHVELIPEQQTFAHMHETLKWESLAPLAELPHGYLLAESDPATYAYLEPLVKNVAAATERAPFFHIGADEPIDLGRGRTPRTAAVFADHVKRVAAYLPPATVPMIWDDAAQQDHAIFGLLPKNVVIVAFHYGVEKTYRPYLDAISGAGFVSMISPSAANFNEIYPDLATSYANVARFTADGRETKDMLGMFMTVWHDDGETLYEATWPALAYAAASAWQVKPVDDASWHRTFAHVFFGSDDPLFAADLDALQAIRPLIRTTPSDPPDYLFWRDPFDARVQARAATIDLAGVRNRAEAVLTHLAAAKPPLHPDAAAAMQLGALRYDQLARRLQIGKEAHDYYDDARAHAAKPGENQVYRSLGIAKYLCWELRNGLADIEPVYAAAWRRESTEPGLLHMLAHYRVAEDDAQRCADRIDGVMREDYLRHATVPPWDTIMPAAHADALPAPAPTPTPTPAPTVTPSTR